MIIMPIPFPYNPYVKKEDVHARLKNSRKLIAFVIFSIVITAWFIDLMVQPRIVSMYQEFGAQLPMITAVAPSVLVVFSIVGLVLAGYFLTSQPNYSKIEEKLAKYKDDELVNMKEIQEFRYNMLIVMFGALMLGFIVLATVVPIYSLTAQVK